MGIRKIKERVKELLQQRDVQTLRQWARKEPRVVSVLLSMGYDRESILTWRAIEAIGPVVRDIMEDSSDRGREIIKRLLWSVTEESGGLGWTAIEMLAECVVSNPEKLSDIPPILISFYEEEIFRPSVLYAICRVGNSAPHLIPSWSVIKEVLEDAISTEDPEVRGWALYCIRCLRDRLQKIRLPQSLMHDERTVKIYQDGDLKETTIQSLAREVAWED